MAPKCLLIYVGSATKETAAFDSDGQRRDETPRRLFSEPSTSADERRKRTEKAKKLLRRRL
jgi:hypothetical protein